MHAICALNRVQARSYNDGYGGEQCGALARSWPSADVRRPELIEDNPHSLRFLVQQARPRAVMGCTPYRAMPHPSLHCRPRVLRAALLLTLTGAHAFAAPTGGVIVSGSGGIASAGTTTTINQATQRISLNWSTFNVGAAETVRFNQPSASALAINRIADVNGSRILGKLQANGQVYLINPHGLIFGAGSQVNVGGLVASTLDIADADLAAGKRHFAGSGTAGVSNAGTLTAAPGGYVALLGGTVTNTGTISAAGGTVALGAGSRVTLNFAGDRLLGACRTEKSALPSVRPIFSRLLA